MSGFFIITRPAFESTVRRLSGQGFKILLDLFASTPQPFRFRELPYTFRERQLGESKLDSFVIWEYVTLLADKLVGRLIPVRLLMFAAAGAHRGDCPSGDAAAGNGGVRLRDRPGAGDRRCHHQQLHRQ